MDAPDPVNVSASALYAELRRLAHHYMRGERAGHVLQTTALVNEAYLKLAGLRTVAWQNRGHFLAMAATAMRRVLVDEARARRRDKRGAGLVLTSIDHHDAAAPAPGVDVEALDAALDGLARLDARQAKIVELRFFAGLTVEEIARALEISAATVGREWTSARAWLYRYLSGHDVGR